MKEIKKEKCKDCGKLRILNKDKICIFCSKIDVLGTEVKTFYGKKEGVEVKSKTGRPRQDNMWMGK